MGENRASYNLLVGKPDGMLPLGRSRRRWVYNTKMDIVKVGWDGVDWIGLAQDWENWTDQGNNEPSGLLRVLKAFV
jgi:hypothetical protein